MYAVSWNCKSLLMENILEEVKREQGVIVFRKALCVEEN